jgi:hypothetical protein
VAEPTPDEIELYSQGSCHVFAIAANRLLAGVGFLVIENAAETSWESEDGDVPAVVHVYALVVEDGVEVALDVFGRRPASEAVSECAERFGMLPEDCLTEWVADEESLAFYVSQGTEDARDAALPLHEVDEEDVQEAIELVDRLFVPDCPEPA